jgi:hypothetical protein
MHQSMATITRAALSSSPRRGATTRQVLVILPLALLAGIAAGSGSLIAGGAIAAVCFLAIVLLWPSRGGTRQPRATRLLLLAYAVPLLAFGRAFALIGRNPFYVPDILLICGVAVLLPRLRLRGLGLFTALCWSIALLALQSVATGLSRGYPAATKGLVLVLYPLLAPLVAAALNRARNPREVLRMFTLVLPCGTAGLLVTIVSGGSYIAAASGLYLGMAAAFAASAGAPFRRILIPSVLIGTLLLVASSAERGPTLTILLAAFGAWLASHRQRSSSSTQTVAVLLVLVIAGSAVTASFGVINPTRVPVAGHLLSRIADAAGNSSAANNISLRQEMWSFALRTAASENPLLGAGAYHPIDVVFQGNDLRQDPSTGVHDSFIGYTFYAGFPAGFLVALVFVLGLYLTWRGRESDPYFPALFGGLIAVVSTAMTNVALETTYIGGPSWLLLAAAFGLVARRRQDAAGS